MNSVLQKFRQNIKQLRKDKNLSQSEFANLLNVTQSKISDWERGHSFPHAHDLDTMLRVLGASEVQWLLGIETRYVNSSGTIEWIEQIPSDLDEEHLKQVEIGIGFFRNILLDNQNISSLKNTPPFNRHTISEIYQAFKSVLRMGFLRIVNIGRNLRLEKELLAINREKNVFPYLKQVIIANVRDIDATLIMTEFMVHLAVQEVLLASTGVRSIGFCSGYTMLRLAEHISFNQALHNNIKCIPFMGYPRYRVSPYSANFIALMFASRYNGEAYRMPFVTPVTGDADREQEAQILDEVSRMSLAFVTVNGLGQRAQSHSPDELYTQLRSSDYFHIGSTRIFYDKLLQEGSAEPFVGQILGYMLDKDANPLGTLAFQKFHRSRLNAIPLGALSAVASSGHVWLLAARQYKAEPTFMALKNGLASCIIVDNTIAEHLVERMKESS